MKRRLIKIKKILYKFLVSFVIFSLVLTPISCFAYIDSSYIWSPSEMFSNVSLENESKLHSNSLNLTCGSAILIEQSTGKILYEHNIHEQLRPASVTKVMTILLIMEAIDSGRLNYNDQIPCSEVASSMGGSQIWLDTKETLSVDEMLKAICVVSANDVVLKL